MAITPDCDCNYCNKMNDLVAEVGQILDGKSVTDIMILFSHILAGIGERLPISNREFAGEFYMHLITSMEDDNGHGTLN